MGLSTSAIWAIWLVNAAKCLHFLALHNGGQNSWNR